jgi:hypothetical protein
MTAAPAGAPKTFVAAWVTKAQVRKAAIEAAAVVNMDVRMA